MRNSYKQFGLPPITHSKQKGKHMIGFTNIKNKRKENMLSLMTFTKRSLFTKTVPDKALLKENFLVVENMVTLVKIVHKNIVN